MKIQNRALAGVILGLRFSPGETAQGDDRGIFDLPDADAEFLLSTSGWKIFNPSGDEALAAVAKQHADVEESAKRREAELAEEAARGLAAEAERAANPPSVVVADDVAEKAALAAAAEGKPVEDEGEEGPDLDALDKEGLIKVAEDYGVEIDKRWGVEKLRTVLDSALYGEEKGD